MALVYAGVCNHGPGTTGRSEQADPEVREPYYAAFRKMGDEIRASGAQALVVIAAEHFANFFMNNMPAYAIGMADYYEGPIEAVEWLKIPRVRVPGNRDLSERLIREVMHSVDVSFAEEWKFDHGVMVPLHFLTPDFDMEIIPTNINCQGPPLSPLHRAWAFGEALRRACDAVRENVAVVGTGGISHWPCTPDSGKINVEFDHAFMERWKANDREALLAYNDQQVLVEAGQGAFEIRTYIATAAAAGGKGHVHFFEPIPIFSTSAVVCSMDIAPLDQSTFGVSGHDGASPP